MREVSATSPPDQASMGGTAPACGPGEPPGVAGQRPGAAATAAARGAVQGGGAPVDRPLRPDEAPVEALTELLQLLVPQEAPGPAAPMGADVARPRAVGGATRPGRGRA